MALNIYIRVTGYNNTLENLEKSGKVKMKS